MKTSNKIMSLLALTLVGGLFLSNSKLKQQLDKIDKSDLYWDYSIRNVGEFHHVKIVGGNLLSTTIVYGDKNQIMRQENLKDWLTAEIKNDTLFVNFASHVPTTRKEEYQPYADFEVFIMMQELRSLAMSKANVRIETETSDTLKIVARNSSSVDLKPIAAERSVDVLIENDSFFGIYNQAKERLMLKNLSITAHRNSQLTLKDIVARKGTFRLSDDTKITADAKLLRNVRVE